MRREEHLLNTENKFWYFMRFKNKLTEKKIIKGMKIYATICSSFGMTGLTGILFLNFCEKLFCLK
jgi:hypothetical protein